MSLHYRLLDWHFGLQTLHVAAVGLFRMGALRTGRGMLQTGHVLSGNMTSIFNYKGYNYKGLSSKSCHQMYFENNKPLKGNNEKEKLLS